MHWLMHLMGLDNASGPSYLFWSGIGADLAEFGFLTLIYRKFNCHQPKCHRIALHKHEHVQVCRKHWPKRHQVALDTDPGAVTKDEVEG